MKLTKLSVLSILSFAATMLYTSCASANLAIDLSKEATSKFCSNPPPGPLCTHGAVTKLVKQRTGFTQTDNNPYLQQIFKIYIAGGTPNIFEYITCTQIFTGKQVSKKATTPVSCIIQCGARTMMQQLPCIGVSPQYLPSQP